MAPEDRRQAPEIQEPQTAQAQILTVDRKPVTELVAEVKNISVDEEVLQFFERQFAQEASAQPARVRETSAAERPPEIHAPQLPAHAELAAEPGFVPAALPTNSENPLPEVHLPSQEMTTVKERLPEVSEATLSYETSVTERDVLYDTAEPPLQADHEPVAIPEQPKTPDWTAELHKPPAKVFEDFTESLQVLVAQLTVETKILPQPDQETEKGETPTIPAIITSVAERLTQLDTSEKEAVAPILKDIIGAIHGLQVLEARSAEPEVLEATQAQLEQLCITLFEALDIEYDEQDIKKFVQVMLRPEFRPQQTQQGTTSEYVGTEARQFARPFQNATNAESPHPRLLGLVALLNFGIRAVAVSRPAPLE